MGLIKSGDAPASLTPFSMADIERQAKLIVLRARQQGDQLLAGARTEAEALKRNATVVGQAEGRRQGLSQGLEEGARAGQKQALEEHRAQLRQAFEALTAAVNEIEQHRADLASSALTEVVQLALAIARRVTKRQGMIEPDVLSANLREAMKLVVAKIGLRVAIHPSQRHTLDGALPQLQLEWPALAHVRVVEDATITPGGCRVLGENGQVDADLQTQLDRVAAELLPGPQPVQGG